MPCGRGAAAASLATLLALTACADGLDEAAVAAAKCASAVHGELGLSNTDTSLDTTEIQVHGSASERTVTGRWSHSAEGAGGYTCVVVPDASDKLRGLRVISLKVEEEKLNSSPQSAVGRDPN